jgi:hypothetical protein
VISPVAEKAEYQKRTTGADESQLDLITKLELTADEFRRAHARTHAHLIALIHTHACGRVYNDTRARTRAQITELSLSGECVATFRRVRDHCIDRGILFMSTPFDTDRAAADRCQAIC